MGGWGWGCWFWGGIGRGVGGDVVRCCEIGMKAGVA